MNSPIKFLFLPTIDVIFPLTLPDTHALAKSTPTCLITLSHPHALWEQQSHHSTIKSSPFQVDSPPIGQFHSRIRQGKWEGGHAKSQKALVLQGVGKVKGHPVKGGKLASPGSGPWQLSLRHRRASPAPDSASSALNCTLFSVNPLARGAHLFTMLSH